MFNNQDILRDLTTEQEAACTATGNLLLTACPGSGKTLVLTRRLAYVTALNQQSRKWNIAITYTNRAADEITNRLDVFGVDQTYIWTGTIHQFCMQFIIRPYAMYSDRLKKGYTIIDEYTQREYGKEVAEILGHNLPAYSNPLDTDSIRKAYYEKLKTNKEIDFEQILFFAHKLVNENEFICTNISSVISSILVDEFQDTNDLQYKILSLIYKKNKSISLLFVGDVNQAIYGSLGGTAKNKVEMDLLFDTTFLESSLTGCFRSTQRIVDLYTAFEVDETGVMSVSGEKDNVGIVSFSNTVKKEDLPSYIAGIISSELSSGTPDSEICIVAPQWVQLFNLTPKLKALLPELNFDAPDISPIKYDPMNPFYLIARLVFTESGKNVSLRKKIATELLVMLSSDFKLSIPDNLNNYDVLRVVNLSTKGNGDGLEILKNTIYSVFELLKTQIEREEQLHGLLEMFFKKTYDRVRRYAIDVDYNSISKFFKEKQGVVLSTLHGVKGEEYTTVISFALLNGYLPHWNYIIKDELKPERYNETIKLLYVLCSRAKQNIYLLSEKGHTTQSGNEYHATDELVAVMNHFKCD